MNSRSRSDSTWPRTSRAMFGQVKIAMMPITRLRPGCSSPPRQPWAVTEQTVAMPMANSSTGMASTMSAAREMTVSETPPR